MDWFLMALKKYAVFEGRSRRREYWFYALFCVIISIVLGLVDMMLGLWSDENGIGLLSGVFSLGVLIPSLAVGARRLHDTGRSGWWLLIGLIPLIGMIVLIIFFVFDSQPGTNAYGPNPKGVGAPA
ncbi:Inner membrane protein YhaH [Burkholderiales bacterium]|nr:Inner membrane protein YhaH [Burkholderiales bacterium]